MIFSEELLDKHVRQVLQLTWSLVSKRGVAINVISIWENKDISHLSETIVLDNENFLRIWSFVCYCSLTAVTMGNNRNVGNVLQNIRKQS